MIYLNIFSTFAILVPVTAALWAVWQKTAGKIFRQFLLFLLYGFLTDLLGWYYYYSSANETLRATTFSIYVLVEASFFLWYIHVFTRGVMKYIARTALMLTLPVWIIFSPVISGTFRDDLYTTTFSIIISFLSGYILLQFAEREQRLIHLPEFWISFGIFFYCFSTFFITTFLEEEFITRIWYAHNVINVATYGFYTVGFLSAGKREKRLPVV